MLEIKTITEHTPLSFDCAVNDAIVNGWDLVRRECFITGADRATTFYAELERIVDDPEEDDATLGLMGHWEVTRNPREPYRCSACGHATNAQWPVCPKCNTVMA